MESKKTIFNWKNIFNSFGVVFLLILINQIYSEGSNVEITLAASATCLIFGRFGDVIKFKLFGLEAELKETIEEAKDAISLLHLLAIEQSKFIVEVIQESSRFSSTDHIKNREEKSIRLLKTLEKLGINSEGLYEVKKVGFPYVEFDLSRKVMTAAFGSITEPNDRIKFREFQGAYQGKGINGGAPPPKELKEILISLDLFSAETKQFFDEYEYYYVHRELKK